MTGTKHETDNAEHDERAIRAISDKLANLADEAVREAGLCPCSRVLAVAETLTRLMIAQCQAAGDSPRVAALNTASTLQEMALSVLALDDPEAA